MFSPLAEIVDVLFNGRSAAESRGAAPKAAGRPAKQPTVNIAAIIQRGTCHVRYADKLYKIVATEVAEEKL